MPTTRACDSGFGECKTFPKQARKVHEGRNEKKVRQEKENPTEGAETSSRHCHESEKGPWGEYLVYAALDRLVTSRSGRHSSIVRARNGGDREAREYGEGSVAKRRSRRRNVRITGRGLIALFERESVESRIGTPEH